MGKTIIKFLPPEEVGEDLSGWWILLLDRDGTCFDSIGPFDSKDFAEQVVHYDDLG